jgi:hypothetical protein
MQKEIKLNPFYVCPLETYEYFLLGPMTDIYTSRDKKTGWERHENLLIEKFAIHSSTLYNIMHGMIEHKSSTIQQKKMGYDLFSVNALIRVLIETYSTFHHIFVSAKNRDEVQFRFLLWQLDGLLEKSKFKIETADFEQAATILKQDEKRIENLCKEIEANNFYSIIPPNELLKIYEHTSIKKKVGWKFNFSSDSKIRPLKIIELVEQVCPTRAFVNTYKYTSVHTHSGYLSIEHFENMRGKEVSNAYTDPIIRLATYLTAFIIKDMCDTDENAAKRFKNSPIGEQKFVNGITEAFRNNF